MTHDAPGAPARPAESPERTDPPGWPDRLRRTYRRWLDRHMREIVRGASTALVLKGMSAALSFGLYVAIGRLLGAAQAGVYFLAFAITTGAATVGRAGLDATLTRFVASGTAVQDWAAVKGVVRKARSIGTAGSLLTATVVLVLAGYVARALFDEPGLTLPLRWMALSVVPIALLNLEGRALQGLKRIGEANLVLSVLLPGISLLGVLAFVPAAGVLGAVWANTVAAVITLAVGAWLWRRATPHLRSVRGRFDSGRLVQSSGPLWWVATLQLVINSTSTLALGVWATTADVGIFNVANRAAMLISLVLLGVNSIVAPKFAALYQTGDLPTLGRIARGSGKLMAMVATPALLACLFFPRAIMGLFGPQFTSGAPVLAILAVGQFINVLTGSVGFLLMMCGFEAAYRNNFVLCAILNVLLNVVLIPRFGILGAAVATSTTLALQNLNAAFLVWQKLGVMTLPFIWPKSRAA